MPLLIRRTYLSLEGSAFRLERPPTCRAPIIQHPRAYHLLPTTFLMQDQFLHAPICRFRSVDFMFRGTGKLMRAGKLAELAAGTANNSENFSFERNFKDSPRKSSLSDEKNLVGARCNADRLVRA